jgi:Met-zincin/Domain of unknown function (DUF5117)/Domain of unknown function (DUF5118)
MKKNLQVALGAIALAFLWAGCVPSALAQAGARAGAEPPHFPDFHNVTKGAKEYDGLFKLYQKDDHLYMEIRPEQFNKPFLCPIAVARGGGLGGQTLNFDEQWVLLFKHVGDKVQLIRRNLHFKAKAGTPLARAVETTYTDSILMALRIATINPMKQAPLISLNDIFMTDFAELGLGAFDANRSSWHKIKAFPRNLELQVEATYNGGRRYFFIGGDDTIDSRGNTMVIHYGIVELPQDGYQPRLADDRVGYFLSAVKDFSAESKDTAFVRYVNRWNLERAEPLDPKHPNKLSVPKKSIKFYIEKTVPHEYRAAVQEGILEWNKAFEKIGFRNAIEVVQERDDEDWDPEDMNYNTFRWITTGQAFAMGPSRANPLTGEILDADILFDADMVRMWKQEQNLYTPSGIAYQPASPIHAFAMGWGLDHFLVRPPGSENGWNETPKALASDLHRARLQAIRQGVCQCGSQMRYELGMAGMLLASRGIIPAADKLPDELINQAVKHVVMHELGHTLGLRHNFKASTMLPNEQLHDTKITHEKGLVGSVMDYSPVNLAPKGVRQGDYYSTTLGPYDYWAIEYAYKPLSGGTEGEYPELQKIATRGAMPGFDYGTDEDLFLTSDPTINVWDLGADVMKFSQDRMLLAEELLKGLSNKVVDKGEGYQRARLAFNILLGQFGNAAYLISRYVGGEFAHRDHRADPKGRDPLVPVTAAKQRAALKFIQEHIFSDKPFQFSPELLRRLAVQRWYHWGTMPSSTDYPLFDRILDIQRESLDHLLSSSALRRIQNNALKAEKGEEPLSIAEVFRGVTDGIWCALPSGKTAAAKETLHSSVICRNLQREHIKKLSELVLGQKRSDDYTFYYYLFSGEGSGAAPPDARSLARMHLGEINKRIDATLKVNPGGMDDATRAHLQECHERIAKVLNASMQVND